MTNDLSSVIEALKYFRAIHIMAMLLVGFGFLMVFVKRYGRSAITATYLLVSVSIPLYYLKNSLGILGSVDPEIDRLILAEFGAASLLICAGAVLGRLKMHQYLLLSFLFVPCYAFNEWILLSNGFGLIAKGSFIDTGGSIVIHAFGALFGIGAAYAMTTEKEYQIPVESDNTSDRFSLLGSMVLWVFWPSFCAALVAVEDIPMTIVNVILALCGSTIATYIASLKLRGKISIADIANAALAGGVAIGSTCDKVPPTYAFAIGIVAGIVSTFGFAAIQSKFQAIGKKIDTCGVLHLHGLPGLFGGLVAMIAVDSISGAAQIKGIIITTVLAIVFGLLVGKILAIFGRRQEPYIDSEEFIVD
ncbi:MAG TPA: ammonium transporter [candidate division Zixibacteria bacterium]|nr:ammonium transporter [candidate division Zixibacteria bacterium]